ncbi:unnamed protein product [Vitrella brassicaformis CCMP3155]|uniref:RRM domain-containing protein n=4 Tax=Vitrella brassicaformis TaxID=1169539 RepID=A0A0G4F1J0_VITBC|nr:unnamed protein product [Vitrella brassicaformis CCMP3155]|eukprot:CEM05593.1 unnamed protein product [Vitrella brassicaformis CCMP3155]
MHSLDAHRMNWLHVIRVTNVPNDVTATQLLSTLSQGFAKIFDDQTVTVLHVERDVPRNKRRGKNDPKSQNFLVEVGGLEQALPAVAILDDSRLLLPLHGGHGTETGRQRGERKRGRGKGDGTTMEVVMRAHLLADFVGQKSAKAGRIMLRNVPFAVTESDLRTALDTHGTISEVTVPKKVASDAAKGFAFVQFAGRESAEAALAHITEHPLTLNGRQVKADWAQDSRLYEHRKKLQPLLSQLEPLKPFRFPLAQALAQPGHSTSPTVRIKEEPVDGALATDDQPEPVEQPSKRQRVANKEVSPIQEDSDVMMPTQDEIDRMRHAALSAAKGEDTAGMAKQPDEEPDGTVIKLEGGSGEAGGGDVSDSIKADSGVRKGSDLSEGRTIFVRNLPYDATSDQLRELFSQFGRVLCAAIVKDKQGQPKGTAFIKFAHQQSADRVLAVEQEANSKLKDTQSAKGEEDKATTGGKRRDRRVDMQTGAFLPLEGLGIHLGGRRIHCFKAVAPAEVETLDSHRQERTALRQAKDRLMRLAKEGYIMPDSQDAKDMPKGDMKRREAAWAEKKVKLKNPNYAINPLRLSIRNLPLSVDPNGLRSAITSFLTSDDRGKAALRAPPSEWDEPQARLVDTVGLQDDKTLKKKAAASVKRVKLVRDQDRKTYVGSLGQEKVRRSKGFAFVDFGRHRVALATLRYLNNNPTVFAKQKRPIVEFAIEDKRALKYKEMRREKVKKRKAAALEKPATDEVQAEKEKMAAGGEPREDSTAEIKKKSRGQRQRERRRQERDTEEHQQTQDEPRATQKRKVEDIATDASAEAVNSHRGASAARYGIRWKKRTVHESDDLELSALARRKRKLNLLHTSTNNVTY